MDVFNPKILDASIRDVTAGLSDNQKVDLLLYALNSISYSGPSRTVVENAVQSCLQLSTISPANAAKALILRARGRLSVGSVFSAQEDLQAALVVEPENPEALALLHQRSVTVEKLLSPQPRGQFSSEIWREIASFLPRRDLKTLLFVPHNLSKIASQLLFRKIDLHFSGCESDDALPWGTSTREHDSQHAQRTADILTRVITDPVFANVVRTLRIYSLKPDKDGSQAFRVGILANALPKLHSLRHVHISSGADSLIPVLQILQTCRPQLRGLSFNITDGSLDLSSMDFSHLAHFALDSTSKPVASTSALLSLNRTSLRTLTLHTPSVAFPGDALSLRNLTHIHYTGHFAESTSPHPIADILSNGRQLESLSLSCSLDSAPSQYFRSFRSSLPFLRHFSFSVYSMHRRLVDRDLFPAIAEFLRGRIHLKTLSLTVPDENIQRAVGFDASVWGVLPSLAQLTGLMMSYPRDLSPGLASWLVPRSVLSLTLEGVNPGRDPQSFFNQLRGGVPVTLRLIGFIDLVGSCSAAVIIEQGFPMVRVLRVGHNYWTVTRKEKSLEMEQWPQRRVLFQAEEWLEWLGCPTGPRSQFG